MTHEPNRVGNIGDLRRVIGRLPDHCPVRIHFGWDLAIVESGIDDDDGALILFADTETGVSAVSTAWVNEVNAQ